LKKSYIDQFSNNLILNDKIFKKITKKKKEDLVVKGWNWKLIIGLRQWWNLGNYQIIIVQRKKKWLGELCENVHHIREARATFSKLWLRSFLVQLELSWQGLPLRAVHGDEVISNMALMIYFSFLSFFLSSFLFLHLFYFLVLFRHEKEMHFFF